MANDRIPLRPLTAEEIKQIENRMIDAVTLERQPKQAPARPPFECRICGSKSYSDIQGQWNGIIGPGGRIPTIAHCCDGCSVVFKDPAAFSVRRRAKNRARPKR